jgi:hypothetical protein
MAESTLGSRVADVGAESTLGSRAADVGARSIRSDLGQPPWPVTASRSVARTTHHSFIRL